MSERSGSVPLAIFVFALGICSFGPGTASVIVGQEAPIVAPPAIVAEGTYTIAETSESGLRVSQQPIKVEQKILSQPMPASQLLPDLTPVQQQPTLNTVVAADQLGTAPAATKTFIPDAGSPAFDVAPEQQYLIESASYLKDVSPFKQGSGPGTNDRMTDWLNSDRSVANYNSARAYAIIHLSDYGWGLQEWAALDRLWWNASGWQTVRSDGNMNEPWGIPQAVPATKMAKYGADYLTNPQTQIQWGMDYIQRKYGSPTIAWQHWMTTGENGGTPSY